MQSFSPRLGFFGGMALLATAAMIVSTLDIAQADPPDKRLQRELRIFERIMDDMLIDSPNWLVPGRRNTRAYHVPDHGVLVTFQASLVSGRWNSDWDHNGFSLRFWDRDDRWDDDEDWDDEDRDRRKKRSERRSTREERLYERGKEEIVDVFLDYGDSFEGVSDNEMVTVVAYLDADVFADHDLRRLEMSARIGDLNRFADGDLSEEDLTAKIHVEEY